MLILPPAGAPDEVETFACARLVITATWRTAGPPGIKLLVGHGPGELRLIAMADPKVRRVTIALAEAFDLDKVRGRVEWLARMV